MMSHTDLKKQIAYLESVNDQLTTEVGYIDQLMKLVGFTEGIATLKATAHEIVANEDYCGNQE